MGDSGQEDKASTGGQDNIKAAEPEARACHRDNKIIALDFFFSCAF